jgi:flagellar hook-associated protein 3 FlgL
MSVLPYGTSAFGNWRAAQTFQSSKAELSQLQNQLASGNVATTHSGLGTGGAGASLALRSRLATFDSYAAAIADGQFRLGVMNTGLEQISSLASSLATSLASAPSESMPGATSVAVSAQSGLQAILDILNTDLGGRYLFSGRATETAPVAPASLILDGDGSRDGLKTLIAQRKAADAGTTGLGRLTLSGSGSDVTLAEEAAGLPFGIKLAGASATGSGVSASLGAGPPPAIAISVAAPPAAGDTITLTLTMPDGTPKTLELVAGSGAAGSFAVGATAADTAANIRSALGSALAAIAADELPSASILKAAKDFFAGDSANPPPRVAGPPYDTATAEVPGTAETTVIWYLGDTSSSPRDTAPLKIGDNRVVGIGAQADEPAFQAVLANFAALAAESFAESDPTSLKRYQALASQISAQTRAPGTKSVSDIAAELSVANTTMGHAASNLSITRSQAADSLTDVEGVDPNEAAMKLLAAQTRLQASYQTTAVLQKLSLVNYL